MIARTRPSAQGPHCDLLHFPRLQYRRRAHATWETRRLFLGYLQGVNFFWPLKALWPHSSRGGRDCAGIVFRSRFLLCMRRKARRRPALQRGRRRSFAVLVNLPLLMLLVATVMLSGSNGLGTVEIFGTEVSRVSLLRDLVLILLASGFPGATPRAYREKNEFNWEPVLEVAKLFAAIFITIVPAIAILKAGPRGGFAPLFSLLGDPAAPNNIAYFWATGILSSFLDNAPTYLIFFNARRRRPRRRLWGRWRRRSRRSPRARFSWVPTPISATRPISWSSRSPGNSA